MRALVMEGFGEPSLAKVGELPLPQIGAEDVLVRIGAAALNPVDWKEVAGFLASFYPRYPARWAPGFDGAGVVEAVGSNVTEFARGERVLVRPDRTSGNGTLAEYARVPRDRAAKAARRYSHAETAALATGGRTAYQALFRPDVGVIKPGQSLLVDGASGGVGSYAIAIAHAVGARTAGTCRSTNADYVCGLGAELALDYNQKDVIGAVKEWMPAGVDVVLDTNSGGHKAELLDILAPGGRLIVVATLTNDADIQKLTARAAERGLSLHFLLLDYSSLRQDMAAINRLVESGRMRTPELTVFPLERAAQALEAIKAGGTRGKIIVEINGGI